MRVSVGGSGSGPRGVRLERLAAAAVAIVVGLLLVQQVRQWATWNPAAVLLGEDILGRRISRADLAPRSWPWRAWSNCPWGAA